jgi:hypothetical protein
MRGPDPVTPDPEGLELVRVERGHGTGWALIVVVAAVVVLAVAIWKPWEGTAPPRAATGEIGAGAVEQLLPAATHEAGPRSDPLGGPVEAPPPDATYAGLDLSVMGTRDPHAAWGIAVGYVPRNQLDNATARGSVTVTPVVDWERIEPGVPQPGPTLDHPDVVSVAIAATWPAAISPVALRVLHRGLARPAASGRPAGTPSAEREIPLGVSLPVQVRLAAGQGVEGVDSALRSGSFFPPVFVAPAALSSGPSDWIGNGWPTGAYVVEIELPDGTRVTLPFTIGG